MPALPSGIIIWLWSCIISIGLLTLCIAVMLWPMPLVSVLPGVWRSRRRRRMILIYAAVFAIFAVCAAWWMKRNGALFFAG